MKSLQTEKQFSYKGLLYKLAIFVVTVCVIVYFLPRAAGTGQHHALVQSILPDG